MANKAQLIETVAEKTGLTKKDATVAVDAVFGSIQDFLEKGDKVQLIGLATLKYANVQHAKVAIRKRAQKLKFLQARYQHLSLVKLLRMQLNN